ncbi:MULTISPECIES: SpoIIE family protein phosphatase [unclassified Thiocapsa]|uniref:SpoIIE family protein phosphatase n=1 Tax=unclassified Thiocapsa TaxID=2641286 RepID=UPI0035AEC39A
MEPSTAHEVTDPEVTGEMQVEAFVIENRLAEMRRVESWLSEITTAWALPDQVAFAVDLVINEAVTNVINHAFRDLEQHDIRIVLRNGDDAVEIEVTDDGVAFDPIARLDVAPADGLEHAEVGGRGIQLIKRFSIDQRYDRVSGQNRLRVRIARPPASDDLELIAHHALFAGIAPIILEPILEGCEVRSVGAGEILLEPGQTNRHLHLVLEGRLKVHLDRLGSDEGFVIEAGECTGEISVVDCRPASAFVVASMPSRLLLLPEALLWDELLRIPRIARNFMRLFADRMRARTQVMQQALEQRLRYEHLQREWDVAREIQLGMLPCRLDLGPEIEIDAGMMAAQEVGGDFYDVFPVGPDEYCIAIGDISGKGMPAALFMVRTLTMLRSELLLDQPLDEALKRINRRLCAENPTAMFATLVIALINKRTGVLRYVNAGHDPILLGDRGIGYRILPPPRGILVGASEEATYEVASVGLRPDDVLVLYTDGVTEAMNADRCLFTVDRLLECLSKQPARSASALAERVKDAIKVFEAGARQSDDLTLVILRYRGQQPPVDLCRGPGVENGSLQV